MGVYISHNAKKTGSATDLGVMAGAETAAAPAAPAAGDVPVASAPTSDVPVATDANVAPAATPEVEAPSDPKTGESTTNESTGPESSN